MGEAESQQIQKLLDSLVGALSTAIDARTPYNANHTRNMVQYASRFMDWLADTGAEWTFDPDRRRTFLLAVWLHDVGKLVVPLAVMDKKTRLGPRLKEVEHRFSDMELLDRIAVLSGRLEPQQEETLQQRRREAWALIRRVNPAGGVSEEDLAAVRALGEATYVDQEGTLRPWLTPEEVESLSVRRGTLTDQEREVMKSHVVMTKRILDQVSFPPMYAQAPVWAAEHHELLDGSGYPNHLKAEEIPREVRLLTVLDIFDALTARDRPYKEGIPVERALNVLRAMAEEGSLDREIVELFARSKAWEGLL